MMPKCLRCGYPISKNDTQVPDGEGVICGICLINLARGQDISKILSKVQSYKPRQQEAAGHCVSLPNVARSLVVEES